jgi:hypothetical protein
MDLFLGRDSFSGLSGDRNAFATSFVGQATFNGYIAFANWARADVEKLLPPDLALVPNSSSIPHLHPVVFVFGEQTEGAALFGGLTIPMGIAYHEFCMAIPFVKHQRGRYLHTYIPRMYSSYFPAIWNGNVHYGFSKAMAKMSWQGPVFMLTTADDALLLHISVETQRNWSNGSRCELANFQAMREVFALPVVGRKSNGAYVRSYFDWDFSDALVRSASSCVSVDAPLVEGLTPRECHSVSSGTFEVRGMLWRLSWPSLCR